MEFDGRDGILVPPIHQHDPSNPSVPSLFATPKTTGFKVNSFLRNGDANPLSDIRCVAPGKGSLPTHAQIGVFTKANTQRRPRNSFGFGDHYSYQNI
jgi:hypothetical protein